ncbi:MAG: hypothetical protein ABIK89_20185 [Planctomycetota bacterium]
MNTTEMLREGHTRRPFWQYRPISDGREWARPLQGLPGMRTKAPLVTSLFWLLAAIAAPGCGHSPGQAAGASMIAIGGLMAAGGVAVAMGGSRFDREEEFSTGTPPNEIYSEEETDPDPETGLPVIAAGLAAAFAGAGIVAASSENPPRKQRPPPRPKTRKTEAPTRPPVLVAEKELAFLCRSFEQMRPYDGSRKYRHANLNIHPLRGKRVAPSTPSRPYHQTRLACDDPIREYLREPYASEPCE